MSKFFIMLHGTPGDKDVMFYPHVYGPFENFGEIQGEMAKRWPNDKQAQFIIFDGVICGVSSDLREKPETEKRAPGDESNWIKKGDVWYCKECGAVIKAARVAHPIHDGPFPMSGSGECHYEEIGYCPNCETKPNFYGSPITPR